MPGGGVNIKIKPSSRKSIKQKDSLKVMSNAEITALVRLNVQSRMPKGPFRGPPLSPTVLTYRSGQFVNSIQVIQDVREKLIKYYYAPNYKVHETSSRAPRYLLQKSIREVVKQAYGETFRINRGF